MPGTGLDSNPHHLWVGPHFTDENVEAYRRSVAWIQVTEWGSQHANLDPFRSKGHTLSIIGHIASFLYWTGRKLSELSHSDLIAEGRGVWGSVSCGLKEWQCLPYEGGSTWCHTGSLTGRGQGHRAVWHSERLQRTAVAVRQTWACISAGQGFFNLFKSQFPHL